MYSKSIYLPTYLSIYLSVYLSIYLFIYLSNYLYVPVYPQYIPNVTIIRQLHPHYIHVVSPVSPVIWGQKKKASFYFFRESALHPFASVEEFRPRKQELSSNILLGSVRKNHQVGKKQIYQNQKKKTLYLVLHNPRIVEKWVSSAPKNNWTVNPQK